MQTTHRIKWLFPPLFLACSWANAAEAPHISGPWTQLRKAPLFESDILPLAPTWGPSLPIGGSFQVEKVYGRWIFGHPLPQPKMKKKDHAPSGWVYSRMLLRPGDSNSASLDELKTRFSVVFHSKETWKKLSLKSAALSSLDFTDSLTLSEGTMKAFQSQDEGALSFHFPYPNKAWAEEIPSMGLSGTDLGFLDQEFKVVQKEKEKRQKESKARLLTPPKAPILSTEIKAAILGRYMIDKYLDLPSLSHEEVDGNIYMRATTLRSLRGCPKPVQDFWSKRSWNIIRFLKIKSRPEIKNPWLQIALPGGYFAVSARAIEVAGNESEMAFLLIRPLVRELRVKRKKVLWKNWPTDLQDQSEAQWLNVLQTESTKEIDNFDVADEIAVDQIATECIARAGYRPASALSYLRKLMLKKDEPWAKWYFAHSIGLEYRIERVNAFTNEALEKGQFPEGKASNPKRFSTASRFWNILP